MANTNSKPATEQKSGSEDKIIADDPTYNQPKPSDSSESIPESVEKGTETFADDPTYNQPIGSTEGDAEKKPANINSKL